MKLHSDEGATPCGVRQDVRQDLGRLKQWRGIATRYDQYALTFEGGVILAAMVITSRVHLEERQAVGEMTNEEVGGSIRDGVGVDAEEHVAGLLRSTRPRR